MEKSPFISVSVLFYTVCVHCLILPRYARDNSDHIAEDYCSSNDKRLAFLGWVVPNPPTGIQHQAVWPSLRVHDSDSSVDSSESTSKKQESELGGIQRTFGMSSIALHEGDVKRDESSLMLEELLAPPLKSVTDSIEFPVPTLSLPETLSVSMCTVVSLSFLHVCFNKSTQ